MNSQLIMLGAPGTGKGTQAKLLREKLGFEHLSTGDLLRKEIEEKSALGQKVQAIMNAGQLVDDSIVISLIKANCNLSSKKYIFDGFPRNLNQAKMLTEEILKNYSYNVVYFEMKYADLVDRIVFRRVCGNCGKIFNLKLSPPKVANHCDQCSGTNLVHRSDDQEEILKNRYEIFVSTIKPVVDYYGQKGVLTIIDASMDQKIIFAEIESKIA